jgi:hypothetical protein
MQMRLLIAIAAALVVTIAVGLAVFFIHLHPNIPPSPQPKKNGCILMKESSTGKVDCFGCGSRVCKDPAPGWQEYVLPSDYVGIPYACYDTPQGCALAQ